jgi:hypothetical protein
VIISDFDHRVDAIWFSCSQRLTLRSFGIIYAELLETYNVGAEYTAIIFSLVIFLVAVGGMSH